MNQSPYPTASRPLAAGPVTPSRPDSGGETRLPGQAPAGSGQASRSPGDEVAVVAVLGYN